MATLVTFLLLSSGACEPPPGPGRIRRSIVGGEEAPAGAYPETVAILDLSLGTPADYYCTGTLIGPRAVVTAAHCLFDWSSHRIPVSDIGVARSHVAMSVPEAEILRVAAGYVPDTYPVGQIDDWETGAGRDDDLALLVLEQEVTGVPLPPILTAEQVEGIAVGTPLLLVGYGVTSLDQTAIDGVKFFAWSPFKLETGYEVVVGEPGQPDTCYGDSGGPAFLADGESLLLVGLTSRATASATLDCGEGTVSTLVGAYRGWLDEHLAPWLQDAGAPGDAAGDDGASPDSAPTETGQDGGPDAGDAADGSSPPADDAGGCRVVPYPASSRTQPLLGAALLVALGRRRRHGQRRRRLDGLLNATAGARRRLI